MKNQPTLIIFIIIFIVGIIALKKSATHSNARFNIAIIQSASHPALDAARDGFVASLQEKLGKDIGFTIRNGEGSINTLYAIAQQFHARQDIDAIYAIATPAAQAIAAVETEKPIIIAAVTVSPELGINFDGDNICGVSDMINVRAEIEAMRQMLPNINTVGIVFNTAETNSVATSKVMIAELERAGYTPVTIGIASESDIEAAVISALRRVDAIITPTDNTVANSIALIADLARKAEKPLIVSDNMLVKHGPLMARGVDYHQAGVDAARIALQLLIDHKKPYELPILGSDTKDVFVNTQTAAALNIAIPADMKKYVVPVDMKE